MKANSPDRRGPRRLRRGFRPATFLAVAVIAGWAVSLGLADTWDPGDDVVGGATALTPSENAVQTHGPHSLDSSDQYDWFTVSATSGRRYCFASTGGIGDAYAEFCSNSTCGTVVASDDNSGGNQQFSFCYVAAATQTYYLRVRTATVGQTWYGDVHYTYALNDSVPAATTNNSDYHEIRVDSSSGVRTDCDCCLSGGTDHQFRVYLDGTLVANTGRNNDQGSSWNWADITGGINVGRNAVAQARFWYTDEDGAACEGWSCEDTLSNHTFAVGGVTTPDPAPGAVLITQDNAPCDSCYDDLTINVGVHKVYDRGVDAPSGLSASPTTDTGTNGNIAFSWNSVADRSGINDYLFQVDDESGFLAPQVVSKSVGTSTSINVGMGLFKQGTTYYWRVAARSACSDVDRKTCEATSGGYHVAWTSTQNFTFSDDDTTQPDMGTVSHPGGNVYDSATSYTVNVSGSTHTSAGDDTTTTFACVHSGAKECSAVEARIPASGSNLYSWDSGDRNADASTIPYSGGDNEIDVATTSRTGSQVRWYTDDYGGLIGDSATTLAGTGDWAQVTIPQVTSATVGYPGNDSWFTVDRMIVTIDLQNYMDEWCSIGWPWSCNPGETNLTLTLEYNRWDDGAWGGWTNLGTYTPTFSWTTRNYTLLDTTTAATIADWNDGGNIIDIRARLTGPVGANAIEDEYSNNYVRYPEVHTKHYWHIEEHTALSFEPVHTLGAVNFFCLVEDDDNDRGVNTDCSASASLDMDYDCVSGAGSTGRSGSCSNQTYTVVDDDTTAPSVTFDGPSYVNGLVQLTAGASDPVEGDDVGVAQVEFFYDSNAGDGCSSWTSINVDSGTPDCDPSFCVNWTPPGTPPGNDGTYCLKAVATDSDNDRSGDALTGETIDNNVIVDRQAPNNPTSPNAKVDNGSCTGSALGDNAWQNVSSDPCFSWTAATDNGLSGTSGYWVYYGSNASADPEVDGGWNGAGTTWTNGTAPGEGTWYFRVKTKDNAGNESTAATLWTIKYDATAPPLSLTNVEGDAAATYYDAVNDANTDIAFTSTDALSGTSACRWYTTDSAYNGGTGTACGSTTSCSVTGAGTEGSTYTRYIACVDAAGNGNSTSSNLDVTWTNDWTAPPLTLTSVEGDTAATYYDNANDTNTDIVLTSTDAVSGTSACRWYTTDSAYNGGTGTACGTTTSCSITGAGTEGSTYTRYIACVDNAGNGNSASTNLDVTWTNDWTVPSISLTSVEGDTTSTYYDNANDGDTDMAISVTDAVSGPLTCKWDTTDIAYSSMTNTCTSTSLCEITGATTEGSTYTRYVACIDNAGNGNSASNNIAVTWTNDWTAPPLTLTSVEGDTASAYYDTSNDSNTDIVLTSTDAVSGTSGCRWYTTDSAYNGGTGTACGTATSCTFTGATTEGSTYTYSIACVDAAGNGNSTSSNLDVTWMNEYSAPSAPTSLAVTNAGSRTLRVSWVNGSDSHSGIQKHTLYRCAGPCGAPGSVAVDPATTVCYDEADANCADAAGAGSLTDATSYCYTVRAVNNAGMEETNTTQVCATAIMANETVSGTVVGYPASAFNGSSQYVGTYVAANSTWLYLLDASGNEIDSVNLGAGNTIAGVPGSVWDGTENVVYVATASGKLFKLKNVDGGAAGDPAGNEFCDPGEVLPGCTFSGTEHKLVDVCTDGSPAPTQLTTRPIGDSNAMWMTAVDADCPTPERVVAVETTVNSVSSNGTVDVVTDFAACTQTQIRSTPKVVTGAGWSATQVHVGSDCPGAANNVKLYRIDADVGNSDCAKDVLGTDIRAWVTGAFSKLYFGTMGSSSALRGFYVIDKYGGSGVCGTDVYETLAGFPYQGPSTDIGNVSRGASVNWNSEQDEVYFGADDGKLHCVCTTTSVQGGNSCVIAVADRCDGTPGVGQACTGFPVTLEAGVALREPLIKDGTIYIASATGKIYAVEPLCDEGGADGTAAGTVKSSNGFTFTLDTTGLDSSVSALDTGGPVRIMVGTNTGRVFYLPVAP